MWKLRNYHDEPLGKNTPLARSLSCPAGPLGFPLVQEAYPMSMTEPPPDAANTLAVDAIDVQIPPALELEPAVAAVSLSPTASSRVTPPSKSSRSSFFQVPATKGEFPLKILIGSWNVGNAMPPKDSELLNAWIPQGGGGFDVIAIGLQESSYREKGTSASVMVDSGEPLKRKNSRSSSKAASQNEEDDDASEEKEIAGEEEDHSGEGDGGEYEYVDETGGEEGSGGGEEDNEIARSTGGGAVIIKKSRAKRSIRKVSKLVKQVSTNLRDSVVDALDYPFSRQLCVHLGGSYAIAGKVELLEMRLMVFVLAKHNVTQTEKLTVATGLGSVIGNKGGLAFKMVVENTSLCFVSCHLAAHQEQKFLDKRNADCASILGAGGLGVKHVQLDYQFDHSFWFGDLNYRVDLQYTQPTQPERSHEQHFQDVLALVKAKKWTLLNANDQLRHQIQSSKALVGWELPPALFPPTFKRERHALQQYNPQRVPSFCDRVLHKSLPGLRNNLTCCSFQCVEEISTSDHKPVVAQFQVLSTPRMTTARAAATSVEDRVSTRSMLSRTTLVEIRDLVAKDLLGMDLTGKSDPYVKFYTLPEHVLQRESSGGHPSTSKIMQTLSPAWQNDQVPKLSLLCDCEADARRVHLVLLVMDYDATSLNDMLGNVVLSLDKFCHGSRPKFTAFDAPVIRHGKPAGTLSGKLRVLLPHQKALVDDSINEVALQASGCHCSLS